MVAKSHLNKLAYDVKTYFYDGQRCPYICDGYNLTCLPYQDVHFKYILVNQLKFLQCRVIWNRIFVS